MQNISPTVNFLLATLQFSLGTIDENEFKEVSSENIDWDIFNDLVMYHKVGSLIHNKFGESTTDYFPRETAELLKKAHEINAVGSLLLSSEVIKISCEFEANQIPALVIKGLAVSNWLYENIGIRSSGDIDLLIKSSNWESALTCMKTMGYEMSSIEERLVPGSKLSKQFIRSQKDAVFTHKNHNVIVELHWRLALNNDFFPLEFDKAWNARTEFDIRGQSIQQLSHEVHAVYLCYHGTKHGWNRLFWLYDIALLMLSDKTDWQVILKIAKQFKATTSLGLALVLASRVFLVPVPEIINQQVDIIKISEQLSDDIFYDIITDAPAEAFLGVVSMCKRVIWQSRINSLDVSLLSVWLHHLTTPSTEDWERIKLPDYLTSFYCILRPFRLIAKGLFGSKF